MNLKNKFYLPILSAIFLIGLFLRVYKIDSVPPSISWDEAAVGYNAWSIANYGTDEWGQSFPLIFKSFEDYKHPLYIYLTVPFVKILGLSDLSVRLPSAVFGALNIILIFILGNAIFKDKKVGLFAAFIMAISPYSLQFSRFNHQLNFTLFFFMLGLLMFFYGIKKKNLMLTLAFVFIGITLFSYHSAIIIAPLILVLLVVFYFKQLVLLKRYFFSGLVILAFFILVIILNPQLSGIARLNQTTIDVTLVKNTSFFKKTNILALGQIEIVALQYLDHTNPYYLFVSGDKNTKFSTQRVGIFYKHESVLLLIGMVALIITVIKSYKDKTLSEQKAIFVLLALVIFAPIPSAAVAESPHSGRAMFIMGSWHLIAAYGFTTMLNILKNRYLKIIFVSALFLIYVYFFKGYLEYYYNVYPQKEASNWQYGMKEIVEYVKTQGGYSSIYMTDVRSQPYIFFLYYLKVPPNKFRETLEYNTSISRSHNLISSFDNFHFGGWDEIESYPGRYLLYIIEPSKYSGLRHLRDFDVKEKITYPDGGDAYYMISGDQYF